MSTYFLSRTGLAFAAMASMIGGAAALEHGWAAAGAEYRSGPSAYFEVLGQIRACTELVVLYREGNWYKVAWGQKEGWVAANSVSSRPCRSSDPAPTARF